jgi:hypothetical protein
MQTQTTSAQREAVEERGKTKEERERLHSFMRRREEERAELLLRQREIDREKERQLELIAGLRLEVCV